MVIGLTCFHLDDTVETQLAKVEFIDENIDHSYWGGVRHIVIQSLGKQRTLASMLSLDITFHTPRPLTLISQFVVVY